MVLPFIFANTVIKVFMVFYIWGQYRLKSFFIGSAKMQVNAKKIAPPKKSTQSKNVVFIKYGRVIQDEVG